MTLSREAQERRVRKEVESKLLEALEGEAREMSPGDWEELRARVCQLTRETRLS